MKKALQQPSLFETQEPACTTPQKESSAGSEASAALARTEIRAATVDPTACPKCGSPSQPSVRPVEMGGERYCPRCPGEDGCYYFTPAEASAVVASDSVAPDEPEQVPLIETGEKWEEHWRGMPEFVQEDLTPWKTIYVHFETRADMERFAKLVKQTVTLNTRSIWYPEAEIGRLATKRYVDKGVVDRRTREDSERSGS